MAFHKASNTIGKLYKGAVQIGKAYKGSIQLYAAEERFSQSISNAYHRNDGYWTYDAAGNVNGWVGTEDKWSDFTVGSIDIPIGETFKIDSLIAQCPNSSSTNIVLVVNGSEVLNIEPPGNATTTYGSYGVYTSTKATGTIQFKIRGKASTSQWSLDPTGYLTINYTIGV